MKFYTIVTPAVTETKTVEIAPAVAEITMTFSPLEAAHLMNIFGERTSSDDGQMTGLGNNIFYAARAMLVKTSEGERDWRDQARTKVKVGW